MTPAESELRAIVGDAFVRDAEAADAIDEVTPQLVVQPGSIEEVSRVMAVAHQARLRVAPRGGGTKLGWGNPPEALDLIVDLKRMNRLLEHAAGDLVVQVEAGGRLQPLQKHLAQAGQMLAIDSNEPEATIGGVIAANASGPRRFRYGTVRDLLIGVTVVLADGTVAKAGGKVVKNVAGYDLAKLMTGSLGTLGIIVKAIFRLHPRPPARRLVVADLRTSDDVTSVVQSVLHSILVPSAIQLAWPAAGEPRLGVLFESIEPSVVSQAELAAEILGGIPANTRTSSGAPEQLAPLRTDPAYSGSASPAVGTGALAADPVPPGGGTRIYDDSAGPDALDEQWATLVAPTPVSPGGITLKVSCLPSELGAVIAMIRATASEHGRRADLTGIVGHGIFDVRLDRTDDGDGEGVAEIVRDLRARIEPGTVVVTAAPPNLKRQVDVWGPAGDAVGLMHRVKDRFDPDHLLNPGRFVGGI